MTLISMKPAILAALVALLASDSQAFTSPLKSAAMARTRALLMAEEPTLDKVMITTRTKKELVFDDKTGRFYETNIDRELCDPGRDDEFCAIDEATGNKIRLTVAEKERIFLDSLQVCTY